MVGELLDRFDTCSIPPDAAIAIVGCRITGKSVLARDLADAAHRGNVVCAMWDAESDEVHWNSMPPGTALRSKLDLHLLQTCLTFPRGCVVLDNCITSERESAADLKRMAEHPALGSITTYQYAASIIPKATRFYFLLKDSVKRERERLWGLCAHWISSNLFRVLLDEATAAPYGALVVDVVERRFWQYRANGQRSHRKPIKKVLTLETLEQRVAVLENMLAV